MKNKSFFITSLFSLCLVINISSCSSDDSTPEEPVSETPDAPDTPDTPNPPTPTVPTMISPLEAPATVAPFIDPSAKTVILSWDGNPNNFASALINAVNEAGTNGVVKIPDGNYTTEFAITLPPIEGVTICGSNRDNVKIESTRDIQTSGLFISRAKNTRFINFTLGWNVRSQVACVISNNGFSGNEVHGMRLVNGNIGFGSADNRAGKPIDFLVASNTIFDNNNVGIFFNRNYNAIKVPKIGKVQVRNCQFIGNGSQSSGISIDCGNDGADGADKFKDGPNAVEAMGVVTDMDGMEISGCTFEKVREFNLAFAKVKNIKIFDNTFKGTTGENRFSRGINVEHESSNIEINNNSIENTSDMEASYISVLTFRDYGNPPLFENGSRQIKIVNNKFSGDCQTGVAGEEAEDVLIIDNEFNTPLPTGLHINFFTGERGNKDVVTARNTNTPDDKIKISVFK